MYYEHLQVLLIIYSEKCQLRNACSFFHISKSRKKNLTGKRKKHFNSNKSSLCLKLIQSVKISQGLVLAFLPGF